ncbi:hypothetical protein PR202_ga24287 [Eleusine coracana subsp. coracana]|uniref:Uncharacterized protein n=1 Tax=Eleusine coracana subsp. coracana TaxID=191504 RepID=A0AAV5D7A9_ELECO|nr:hypothetical protein PR202_ga24287 [Eleusine coracana subsp. coracana]
MDTEEYWALQQGSSSSCRTADAAAWDPAQQQKRQRCQGSSSSSDQAGSSTSNPLQISEPEKQDLGSGEIEEEEDYYMEDDCDEDEGYDEDEYEFDQADFNQHLADKFDGMDLPPGVEATVPWLQKIAPKEQDDGSSGVNTEDENTKKLNQFKQFDTVQNFSDHHFAQNSEGEPSRAWSKRIQHDWKLLEKDLPGHGCEKWNPAHSTMLQVLVSIQALILNEKPYFNEPGFEASANTTHGQTRATDYNDNTFVFSCKTMLYSLRRPPEHFADLVAGHFRVHGHTILAACKYYMEGNAVGSLVPEDKEESDGLCGDAGASSSSNAPKPVPSRGNSIVKRGTFNANLKTLFEDLLMEFNVKGADTKKFIAEKLKKNLPAP